VPTRLDSPSIDVALAVTDAELDAASRLVHECYRRRGYVKPTPDGRHANPYLAQPSTAVFVARVEGAVVATVSLIADSAHRLPCDALWGAELGELRADHRRLAEVSALAVSEAWRGAGLLVMRALVRAVGVYGREFAGFDTLCIAVHPRHASFYESLLAFRRFGAPRRYEAVNTHAEGLLLDLRQLDRPLDGAFAAEVFTSEARRQMRLALQHDLRRRRAAQRLQLLHSRTAVEAFGDRRMC